MGISDGRGTCKDKVNGGQMRRIKCTYRVVSQDKAGRKTERSLIREDGTRNDYIRFISTNPIRSVWKKRAWDLQRNRVVKTSHISFYLTSYCSSDSHPDHFKAALWLSLNVVLGFPAPSPFSLLFVLVKGHSQEVKEHLLPSVAFPDHKVLY